MSQKMKILEIASLELQAKKHSLKISLEELAPLPVAKKRKGRVAVF